MNYCDEIQDLIITDGLGESIDDKKIQAHIAGCQECKSIYQNTFELNKSLAQLPEYDVEDSILQKAMEKINQTKVKDNKEAENVKTTGSRLIFNPQWASGLAATFVCVSLLGLLSELSFPIVHYNEEPPVSRFTDNRFDLDEKSNQLPAERKIKSKSIGQLSIAPKTTTINSESDVMRRSIRGPIHPAKKESEAVGGYEKFAETSSDSQSYQQPEQQKKPKLNYAYSDKPDFSTPADDVPQVDSELVIYDEIAVPPNDEPALIKEKKPNKVATLYERAARKQQRNSPAAAQEESSSKDVSKQIGMDLVSLDKQRELNGITLLENEQEILNDDEPEKIVVTGSRVRRTDLESVAPVTIESVDFLQGTINETRKEKVDVIMDTFYFDTPAASLENSKRNNNSATIKSKTKSSVTKTLPIKEDEIKSSDIKSSQSNPIKYDNEIAKKYLSELQSLGDLDFKKPTGYWANTYIPGDSDKRRLKAQLQDWDRTQIKRLLNSNSSFDNAEFEQNIQQNNQPFDSPINSAMAVYLQSDQKTVQGTTRMRLQVGLQASRRQSGHRSTMNVGVVFDVKNKTESVPKLKALLMALLKQKQPGDNFSLAVTGEAGGLIIKSEEFRHGPIQVALNNILADKTKSNQESYLTLKDAVLSTNKRIKQNDNPSSSLGSSVLLYVTDGDIDDSDTKMSDSQNIEALVHKNALQGIVFSSVSLGVHIKSQKLESLVLAGQGNNRVLHSVTDASRIIEEELFSSSRAVARALRLRIRLAKGVRLINVLDSYRLDEARAQRVRDAEKSIDQRLAKNLGIKADRGDDEEGIQIVIPNFFAGDTHVVLLDIVADSSGPIADVSVRYKDLLYLRNAVVRKHLSLNENGHKIGPLELNVLKNLLARDFSKSINRASKLINSGDVQGAIDTLNSMQKLYRSMRLEIPAWSKDKEILMDELFIKQTLAILKSKIAMNDVQLEFIAGALDYSSWRKQASNQQ